MHRLISMKFWTESFLISEWRLWRAVKVYMMEEGALSHQGVAVMRKQKLKELKELGTENLAFQFSRSQLYWECLAHPKVYY